MSNEIQQTLDDLKKALKGPTGARPYAITSFSNAEHNTGVWVYDTPVPGLVVHRNPYRRKQWTVTHEPSSFAFRMGFRSKKDAVKAAMEYAKAAPDLDFTRPFRDLTEGYFIEKDNKVIHVPSIRERMDIWRPIFEKYDKISGASGPR